MMCFAGQLEWRGLMRLRPGFCTLMLVGVATAAFLTSVPSAVAADAVTEWTLEADRLGQGDANWRTLAIMHQAVHDAANAVQPRYGRWSPPLAGEPPAAGARLEAAIAGAAAQVLVNLHPDQQAQIGVLFQSAMRRLPVEPAVQAGLALGQAIGNAAVTRRRGDGFERVHAFTGGDAPGRWRPVPPSHATSNTTATVPFLFASRNWGGASIPPVPGSPAFLRDVAEVRRIGGLQSSARTAAETYAGAYWAYQSSQRGFILLGASLLDSHPMPGGLLDHARVMSQLASAMADAAIMAWAEKERFVYWRPITVIQGGYSGVRPDPGWTSLIETPPHPEYPSGHATDCFTGAGVLAGVFGRRVTPITYVAQSGIPQAEMAAIGMGPQAQLGNLTAVPRRFPSFAAIARECSLARIWAGAHFRSGNREAERLGGEIAARALAAVPGAERLRSSAVDDGSSDRFSGDNAPAMQ